MIETLNYYINWTLTAFTLLVLEKNKPGLKYNNRLRILPTKEIRRDNNSLSNEISKEVHSQSNLNHHDFGEAFVGNCMTVCQTPTNSPISVINFRLCSQLLMDTNVGV